ncbi:DUF6664 family protein [Thomasclavelia sp.]
MNRERMVLEVLEDCQIEMMDRVENYLHDKSTEYIKVSEKIKYLIDKYPRILEIENMNTAMSFNKDEINAIKELYILDLSKNVLKEKEIYNQGIRDCFEVMIGILGCDRNQINIK